MNTHILAINSDPQRHHYAYNVGCCEYLKGNDMSGRYDEMFITHPAGYELIPKGDDFLQMINDNIPYFTLSRIGIIEYRKRFGIKKDSKAREGIKGDAAHFERMRGAQAPIFHVKINTKEYPNYKNLLTPTTMLRFTLTAGDVQACVPLVKKFIAYNKIKPIHLPSMFQVLDSFHGYYKVTSESGFASSKRGIVEGAFKEGSSAIGTVQGFFQQILGYNKWYKANQHNKFFSSYVMNPFITRMKALRSAKTGVTQKILSGQLDVIPLYEGIVKAHIEAEERLKKYHEAGNDEVKRYELQVS